MINVPRVEAVSLRPLEEVPSIATTAKPEVREGKIQLVKTPPAAAKFFESVPLGATLEAEVVKASKEELLILLNFQGRKVEISVKNPLGLDFIPGQKILLTLVDRNPYILKIRLPIEENYRLFSLVRSFFNSPLGRGFSFFLNLPSLGLALKNSGIFYEHKFVRYLLGQEKKENLQRDIKYKLLTLIRSFSLDRPKHQLIALPAGFNQVRSLPEIFRYVNLKSFLEVYSPFYELSPRLIETLDSFIFLTRREFLKKIPPIKRRKIEKGFLEKKIFLSKVNKGIFKNFPKKAITISQLKELMDFIQTLQGWAVSNHFRKVIIPITYQGENFFVGIYEVKGKKNISLLWKDGLVKITYTESRPIELNLFFILKNKQTMEKIRSEIDQLKKELQQLNLKVENIDFSVAPNVEELFILDMADSDKEQFMKMYL
jgi:hypothetical protein